MLTRCNVNKVLWFYSKFLRNGISSIRCDPLLCTFHVNFCEIMFARYLIWLVSVVQILTIQPPTYEIFTMISRVALISTGRLMYFGRRREMLPYFAFIEYPCPAYKNPSDYYRQYQPPTTSASPTLYSIAYLGCLWLFYVTDVHHC